HAPRLAKLLIQIRNASNNRRQHPPPPHTFTNNHCFILGADSACETRTALNLFLSMSLCVPPYFIHPTVTPFPIGTSTHDRTYYSQKYKRSVRPTANATICPPPPHTGLSY
ncbi:HCMVUS36, partial [Human betaherpesvirus 5]|uniref:Uncharacterized protein US36 n=1 Tax=Human cytomegalovirus (strain AD169) TaxID=10360 RepID=US36_HCMVA